ncbi:Hypothetical predicted protein [Pelobates cultripes]|uniref:Uncharacterized protein n=1 Tax=Pelobates cultripes TaxID=61616 RepID=A0AAD1SW08_PELCU|nr:Hypothetical predicted protein [Pelobates cultripes]
MAARRAHGKTMRAMMAEFSDTMQASMKTQIQIRTTELRKDIPDIGNRTSHLETKVDEFAV